MPSCDDWNTRSFFEIARVEDVRHCLDAGAEVNARGEAFGRTPLHAAAAQAHSETPALVQALLDAVADPAEEDKYGNIPWDYAQEDVLRVLRRLNEGRFKIPTAPQEERGNPVQAVPSCDGWNTRSFFETARVEDVRRCLDTGVPFDVWDFYGDLPLHKAARDQGKITKKCMKSMNSVI